LSDRSVLAPREPWDFGTPLRAGDDVTKIRRESLLLRG
jgi:hypothetical protein